MNRAELADGPAHHEEAVLFAGDISQHRMNRSRQPTLRGFIGNRVDFVAAARGGPPFDESRLRAAVRKPIGIRMLWRGSDRVIFICRHDPQPS